MVYSTRRFVLCLTLCHFVLVFFSTFSITRKRELNLVRFVRLLDLCLFGFVGFLFLLVSGKGCGLWLWHSLDFSLTFFFFIYFFVCCVVLSLCVPCLLLVPREVCASWMWHFLGVFTCIYIFHISKTWESYGVQLWPRLLLFFQLKLTFLATITLIDVL